MIEAKIKTRLKPYPVYKDSGIEWMGVVPEHWEVWKVTHGFKRLGSGTTPKSDDLQYYDGDIQWVTTSELRENIITDTTSKVTDQAIRDYAVLRPYPPNTLLFAMYGATIGRMGILGITATVNQACCAFIEPRQFDTHFVFYWLLIRRPVLIAFAVGGGQPNLSQDALRDIRIPCPCIAEQRVIAAFLDRETEKIDKLISLKERQIELLQEKRTALISHAVTKGLNPNVPLKDSGVEWLGKIPKHWKIKRLKNVTKCLDGRRIPLNSEQRGQMKGDYPYWGANGIVDYVNDWLFDEKLVLLGEDGAPFFERNKNVVFFVEGKIWVNNHAHVLRPKKSTDPKFLTHLLNVVEYRAFIDGSTRDKLTQEDMNDIPVQCPPIEEQQDITTYLDRETAKIDALIHKNREVIDKLQEYRTALISAAVTGKIDVRKELDNVKSA